MSHLPTHFGQSALSCQIQITSCITKKRKEKSPRLWSVWDVQAEGRKQKQQVIQQFCFYLQLGALVENWAGCCWRLGGFIRGLSGTSQAGHLCLLMCSCRGRRASLRSSKPLFVLFSLLSFWVSSEGRSSAAVSMSGLYISLFSFFFWSKTWA